ncbi:MAG: substrate-binding domain-containing protein [Chloroflexota bacterium]
MNQTRMIFVGIIAVAALIICGIAGAVFFFGGSDNEPAAIESAGTFSDANNVPSDAVLLTIASSSTKQKWMEQVVENFAAEEATTSSGSRIVVEVAPVLSGGSMNAILAGDLQPVVWSPGAASWVAQFDETWQQQTNLSLMSEACPESIYTPLGFAMWRPMAEALGWPDQPIGWNTIVELSEDPKGWETYGHPEWGKFRFGHAHPEYSNAGLLTMTSFVYGMTGKTDELMAEEVYAPNVESSLSSLGQNTAKYGMITTNLLNAMVLQGPRFLHAVATFESDTVRLNLERSEELRFPMAFVFPSEGTFWGNHPYCILDKADWVSEEQAEAAAIFRDYLLSEEQQTLAIDSLLRPLDSSIPLKSPLDLANGTNPEVKPETVPPLAFPDADVSAAVKDLFMLTKRKSTVLVVLDTSGSMEGERIQTATEATVNFLSRLHPDDEVGVFIFSDGVTVLGPPSKVSGSIEDLSSRVGTLVADGNTALYQAVCDATEEAERLQQEDLDENENRLYGIVVLSDGEDTIGQPSENQMFTTCLPDQAEADGVKIFPIAFGDGADESVLKRVADVTGGNLYKADPDTIDRIYLRISAEQ